MGKEGKRSRISGRSQGGCTVGWDVQSMESFQPDLMEGKRCFVGKRKGVQSDVQSMESFQPDE
jgi:hypothetical protein